MTKLTAVLMFLLFANASARKISSISVQEVDGKLGRSSLIFWQSAVHHFLTTFELLLPSFIDRNAASALESATKWADAVKSMVDPIKGQLDNVDKAIDIATKARTFITGMKSDHAVIINLSAKEGTWFTYNDISWFKWTTQFRSYMGAYTTISVHTLGWGTMHCFLNNKDPPFTVQRNAVYNFDGKNLNMWFNKTPPADKAWDDEGRWLRLWIQKQQPKIQNNI